MAARLSHEKNIKLALKVMSGIIKEIKALLVIVGDGPEKKNIELEIRNLKLDNCVRLDGWQENLSGYYNSADIFLITSNYEGYALAAVEALAAGLPVIMTNVGVAGAIVKNGENGMVVLVGDAYGFNAAISKVFKNKELRLKLKEGARNTKFAYNSFEDYREKLILSFKTCLK